jgi:3-hydroxyacyl-[acyl-carrier-protein] dehydratase
MSLASPASGVAGPLGIDRLRELLPHCPPFLFIDRLLSWELGRRAVGLKNVSANEAYSAAHFPGMQVMPGVLIIEALAQTLYALDALSRPQEPEGTSLNYLGSVNVRLLRPVVPGDQLLLKVEITKFAETGVVAAVTAQVEQFAVSAGELVLVHRPRLA